VRKAVERKAVEMSRTTWVKYHVFGNGCLATTHQTVSTCGTKQLSQTSSSVPVIDFALVNSVSGREVAMPKISNQPKGGREEQRRTTAGRQGTLGHRQ